MAAARSLSRQCLQSSHSAPAARAFLQIASRRPLPIFEFLVPAAAAASHHAGLDRSHLRSLPKPYPRPFSTSVIRKQTIAIHNPRQDDDGKDMAVEITPRASNRLKEIMVKDSNPNLALRITVESGGCHGFQYLMSLTTLPAISQENPPAPKTSPSDDNVMPSEPVTSDDSKSGGVDEDDTVFQATDGSEAKVVMDGPSLELLKGSKIDFTMELIGSQFKIVDNPLATSSCGCGTSFDIKS